MENAELYSTANGMQKKDAKDAIAEFVQKIKWTKNARILDIGCGSGDVTTEILLPQIPKDFKELTGVDTSLEMIQHARNLYTYPKVSFVQFDLLHHTENILEELTKIISTSRLCSPRLVEESLQKKSHNGNSSPDVTEKTKNISDNPGMLNARNILGYDIIFSFYCLHWILDQRLAIENIYSLLNSGGESLMVFLAKSPIFTLYRKLSTMESWKCYMQDVENFIPFYQDSKNALNNFKDILHSAGFQLLTVECRKKNYKFESFLSLRNAIVAVNPFLSRIPHNLQEEFINECLRLTKTHRLAEYKNNCYNVCYKLIVAHVRKPFLL